VRHVTGLKGIVNRIRVVPVAATADVKRQIVRALHREADVDAHGIGVHVSGHTATLSGRVRTWHEYDAAEHAAMHAPGITRVDNRITVSAPRNGVCDEIC
jgi:osmotically-inducible protein OsmY